MSIGPMVGKVAAAAAFGSFAVASFVDARKDTREAAAHGGLMHGALGIGSGIGEALCAAELGAAAIGAKLLTEHADTFGGTTAKVLQHPGLQLVAKGLAPVLLGIGAGRMLGAVVGGLEGASQARQR